MKLLAGSVLISTALAATPIWGAFPSNPDCDNCLDQTFESCPGDYMTEEYARCMCAGDGGTNMVTCSSICGIPDNLGISWAENVASGWYTYCIMWPEFKVMCKEAEQYVTPALWADPEYCGAVDTSGGGSGGGGSSGGGSDDGEESSGGGITKPTSNPAPDSGENQPTPTNGPVLPVGSGDPRVPADGPRSTSSSRAAANTANPLPTLGVMLGLGVMGMNL